MIYAEIEIKEWGEEPRYRTIGPFHGTEEEIRTNLEERGDVVARTWEECPRCGEPWPAYCTDPSCPQP